MEISGRTKILAHFGVPTETFKAPMIFNPWFREHGIDCVVVPMGAEADDYRAVLPLVMRMRNVVGALVTMPHKTVTAEAVDDVSDAVRIAGACNAVRRDEAGRLVGDMFDGEGFVGGLRRHGRATGGASALVVGVGGVGSAIAASLAAAGVARLRLVDTDIARSEALAGRLRALYPRLALETGPNDPAGHDIAVNATPLGMKDDDPLPMDVERIAPATFVGEVVLRQETRFLAAVRARGCATQIGTDMLFEQIPAYLRFFGFPDATSDELRRLARITY